MKLSSLFTLLVTLSILSAPTFAQDAIRPNPQVEAKAAQALLNTEIRLQKAIPLNMQQKPDYNLYSQNFNDIAIAFARLGRTQSALKATQFMTSNSAAETTSEVLRLSVRRSAILGDVERAASLIPQIKNNNAKADALLTVARAYLRKDDYPAAQKVLFQVTPLVPKRFGALLYTASLFAQSGNYAVSKRLFDRAKGMMVPIPSASESEGDFRDVHGRYDTAFSQIRAFDYYALNAGLVDEWRQLRESKPGIPHNMDLMSLTKLLQLNEIDLAIKVVKQSSPENIVAGLCLIAYYISPEYPDRAYSLLNEASDAMPLASTNIEKQYGKEGLPEIRQNLDMFLASGYQKLGKEEDYQKWQQQLTQDTPLNKQALTQLKYAIYPLFLPYLNTKSTFPPDQLLQINDKIQPLLPKLQNNDFAFSIMKDFINAQIAAGQIKQTRGNIEFLDTVARKKIISAKNTFDFNKAISVADLWKRIGDQQNCIAILQAILNALQKIPYNSKIQRIRSFISRGFVDEGLQFFYSLPGEGKKPPQSLMPELPYALAIAHPNQFPYELLKAKESYMEAQNISAFARGLTTALFQTPSEQKIILDSNGGGAGVIIP